MCEISIEFILSLAGKFVQLEKFNIKVKSCKQMKKKLKLQIVLLLILTHMISTSENKDIMNSNLNELELTPFKVHAVPVHMKAAHGKRKVNNEVSKRLATILNVEQSEIESKDNSIEVDVEKEIREKADDLDKLTELMKEKLKFSNRREKIQVLTLAPDSSNTGTRLKRVQCI